MILNLNCHKGMKNSILQQQNIFAVPCGDFWNIEPERIYMVYAPLNGSITLATPDNVTELELCADGKLDDVNKMQLLSKFQAKGSVPVHYLPQSPHDLYQIDILLNYTCNFKCIYCYSAAGRSSKQIEFDKIKALIDYLFCSGKKQTNPYIINFSGGGEPLLSFELIQKTVEYIEKVNIGRNYIYNIGLVTNGSLITPDIIEFFQKHKVDMAVSFEILEGLQNKERGSYDKVAANIDMMLEKDFPFGIRTTFTPESVTCMTEMIEEISIRFPKLRRVIYDTVLAPSLFESPKALECYYNAFIDGFYKAKAFGKSKGINVESIAVETLSMVRDRTCEGKIVLTPMGSISSCARVSSPLEKLYDDYIYGNIENGVLEFDTERFKNIICQNNIYSQPMCEACYAKWNCGGGCRLFHHSFNEDYEKVRCDFVRKGLKIQMFNILSDNYKKHTGKDLIGYISEKIKNNEL